MAKFLCAWINNNDEQCEHEKENNEQIQNHLQTIVN